MFVPVIIPTQDASPHAQELGRRIAALIREYRLQHQDASSTDVQFALRIAEQETGGLTRRRRLVVGAGVVAALLGVSWIFFARASGGEAAFPMVVVAGLILVVLIAVIALKRRIG